MQEVLWIRVATDAFVVSDEMVMYMISGNVLY